MRTLPSFYMKIDNLSVKYMHYLKLNLTWGETESEA